MHESTVKYYLRLWWISVEVFFFFLRCYFFVEPLGGGDRHSGSMEK